MQRPLFSHHLKAYGATLTVVVLASLAPAVTRLSLSHDLGALDLVLLRCGIGGLVFLPFLLLRWRKLPRQLLWQGVGLAFLHGWGMHLTATAGLQFSPAGHASALGPGFLPVWVMMWRWLLTGAQANRLQAIGLAFIASGALVLVGYSYGFLAENRWLAGDSLFLLSSCMAAAYLVHIQRHETDPLQIAALVAVYSGIAGGLLLLAWPYPSTLWSASREEVLLQAVFQGLGMGAAAILLASYATRHLGSQRCAIFLAAIPALSLLFGRTIAEDDIHAHEAVAVGMISLGILFGAVLGGPRAALQPAAAPLPNVATGRQATD